MKRLRLLFAVPLFLMALSIWRFMDLINWLWPQPLFYSFSFFILILIFLALPVRLMRPGFNPLHLLLGCLALACASWFLKPLSTSSTSIPEQNHCGLLTYTGFFYPLRMIVTQAHQDDLEVRNQLCWLRKMVKEIPDRFEGQKEIQLYLKGIQDRLLRPAIKFRATLPLVALLHGMTLSSYTGDRVIFENVSSEQLFLEGLQFWVDQYTYEISSRDYPLWNWPHSSYMKWEYGLIEKNWEQIIQNIELKK